MNNFIEGKSKGRYWFSIRITKKKNNWKIAVLQYIWTCVQKRNQTCGWILLHLVEKKIPMMHSCCLEWNLIISNLAFNRKVFLYIIIFAFVSIFKKFECINNKIKNLTKFQKQFSQIILRPSFVSFRNFEFRQE